MLLALLGGCQTDTHTHTFSKDWTSDAGYHWHEATCSHTEEVSEKAAHVFGEWIVTVKPTEWEEGISERTCLVCEYKETERIEKLEHKHTFAEEWTSDAECHWHAATCEHDSELGDYGTHTFGDWFVTEEPTCEEAGSRKCTCTVCGYEKTEEIEATGHSYYEYWSGDDNGHYHYCSRCGTEKDESAHEFGEWNKSWDTHWHYCTVCGYCSGHVEHTFGDWTVTQEPTCVEEIKSRFCSECGYEQQDTIEATGQHTYEDWTIGSYQHWRFCTVCGDRDLADHTFGDWEVTKEATCAEEGEKSHFCTVCGEEATEVIPATGQHTCEWKVIKEPTCGDTGWRVYCCTVCESVLESEKMETIEHIYSDWEVTKEATCGTEGLKERHCTMCRVGQSERIEATGQHAYGEWGNDSLNHWKECSVCGMRTDMNAHVCVDWTVTKEPSCTTNGSKKSTCTVCGYESIEYIPAGHKLSETEIVKQETCTEDGLRRFYCTVCGWEYKYSVRAHHNFSDWEVTKEATCEAGIKKRSCMWCEYEETEQIPATGHTFVNGTCINCGLPKGFVKVKGGTIVGKKNTDNYEGVFVEGRTVILSDFYMAQYEVTQDEYREVMTGQTIILSARDEFPLEANPSYCTADNSNYAVNFGTEQGKRPVEGVTWYDAVYYCNARSIKEGLEPAYTIDFGAERPTDSKNHIKQGTVTLDLSKNGYRLPTEAEWEYAARGGDPTAPDWDYTFSGADDGENSTYKSDFNPGLDSVGWYSHNNDIGISGINEVTGNASGKGTHQVGQKAPNALGLYDMSGNVGEMCYDKHSINIGTGVVENPKGASSGKRVYLGGSWAHSAGDLSVCNRDGVISTDGLVGDGHHFRNVGFRVVRSAK